MVAVPDGVRLSMRHRRTAVYAVRYTSGFQGRASPSEILPDFDLSNAAVLVMLVIPKVKGYARSRLAYA